MFWFGLKEMLAEIEQRCDSSIKHESAVRQDVDVSLAKRIDREVEARTKDIDTESDSRRELGASLARRIEDLEAKVAQRTDAFDINVLNVLARTKVLAELEQRIESLENAANISRGSWSPIELTDAVRAHAEALHGIEDKIRMEVFKHVAKEHAGDFKAITNVAEDLRVLATALGWKLTWSDLVPAVPEVPEIPPKRIAVPLETKGKKQS